MMRAGFAQKKYRFGPRSDSSNPRSLTSDARHVSDLPVGLGKFFRSPTFEIPVRDRKSLIAPFGKSETYRASEVKDPSLLESLVGSGDILFVQSPARCAEGL